MMKEIWNLLSGYQTSFRYDLHFKDRCPSCFVHSTKKMKDVPGCLKILSNFIFDSSPKKSRSAEKPKWWCAKFCCRKTSNDFELAPKLDLAPGDALDVYLYSRH